jgi:hypothetical protein
MHSAGGALNCEFFEILSEVGPTSLVLAAFLSFGLSRKLAFSSVGPCSDTHWTPLGICCIEIGTEAPARALFPPATTCILYQAAFLSLTLWNALLYLLWRPAADMRSLQDVLARTPTRHPSSAVKQPQIISLITIYTLRKAPFRHASASFPQDSVHQGQHPGLNKAPLPPSHSSRSSLWGVLSDPDPHLREAPQNRSRRGGLGMMRLGLVSGCFRSFEMILILSTRALAASWLLLQKRSLQVYVLFIVALDWRGAGQNIETIMSWSVIH